MCNFSNEIKHLKPRKKSFYKRKKIHRYNFVKRLKNETAKKI